MHHYQPITDRKIRLALVGCGRIAANHFGAIEKHQDRVDLVDICDVDPQALAEAVARTGAQGHRNLTELLANTSADLVILATPQWAAPRASYPGRPVRPARHDRETAARRAATPARTAAAGTASVRDTSSIWETPMQVEAIYNQGRIELTQPLQLRHPRVRVIVEVPDEEVLDAPSMATESPAAATLNKAECSNPAGPQDDILGEIKHILGPLYRQRSAASVADDKQALLDSLAEKHA